MGHPPRRPTLSAPLRVPRGLDATILLLRHGESEWVADGRFQGQGDPLLSPLGRRQAELAGRRLADPARPPALPVPAGLPQVIVHSPLQRAVATAAAVAAAIASDGQDRGGPPPMTVADAGFIEIGQGEWEGVPAADIASRWGATLAGWRRDPLTAWAPGGESLPEVDRRVRLSLEGLLATLGDGRVAGTTNRSQVLGYRDAAHEAPWAIVVGHDGLFKVALLALLDLPLARFWSLPFALCGITIVEFQGGRARLRAHNLVDHLASLEARSGPAGTADRDRSGAL